MKEDNLWDNKEIKVWLKELLKIVIGNWFVVKNVKDSNEDEWIIVESYFDGKKEEIVSYDPKKLCDITTLLQDITLNWYEKYGCDNFYVIKWSWHKLECNNWLMNAVRVIYDLQTEDDLTNEEKKKYVDDIIKYLEEYKEEL